MERAVEEYLQLYLDYLEKEAGDGETDAIIVDEFDDASLPPQLFQLKTLEEKKIMQEPKIPSGIHQNDFLHQRELGSIKPGFNRSYFTQKHIPNKKSHLVDVYEHQINISQFSNDGSLFFTGSHDHHIRLYTNEEIISATSHNRKALPFKKYKAPNCGYTIIDMTMSATNDFFLYTSWSSIVNLVFLKNEKTIPYDLKPDLNQQICPFSIKINPNNREFVVGCSDKCIYHWDIETSMRYKKIVAHEADVNAICYLDKNIIISGGDDAHIRMWDSRVNATSPLGYFPGHVDGVTSLAAKSDGFTFISNSKDQSMKMWDLRKVNSTENKVKSYGQWDYRYQQCPGRFNRKPDHLDCSVMTFWGHQVLQTLIRCHISPEITKERFAYSGSQDGKVYIYDTITGDLVSALDGHSGVVRDMSWHPQSNTILSSSWDKSLVSWEHRNQ